MKRFAASVCIIGLTFALAWLGTYHGTKWAQASAGLSASSEKPIAPLTGDRAQALRADLEVIFNDSQMENALWGVMIQSADTGEIIYRKNARQFIMPASNMKILTGVAALTKLGPDYTYATPIYADGPLRGGELIGNLVVEGQGDPTIGARFGGKDAVKIFKDWADTLKGQGIRSIRGDIIGVDDVFDREPLGYGWSWDDLPYGYSAEISGLPFNENTVDFVINDGEKVGDKARIQMRPETGYIRVINNLITVKTGQEAKIQVRRDPRGNTFTLSGAWPIGSKEMIRDVAVHDPAAFFTYVLKEVLQRNGIKVSGQALAADKGYRRDRTKERRLFTHTSPPLGEIVSVLLKVSQNLYAETLVKTIGRVVKNDGSFAAGSKAVEEVLSRFGIPPKSYVMRDGSGLSRYNYVTAEMLLHILRKMYRHPHFKAFYDALPIAGIDGTLQERMKGTRAENNVRAKTGTIANTRALSGYVTTRDGEILAFAMIANHFNVPNSVPEYVQDLALERLANFSRREP